MTYPATIYPPALNTESVLSVNSEDTAENPPACSTLHDITILQEKESPVVVVRDVASSAPLSPGDGAYTDPGKPSDTPQHVSEVISTSVNHSSTPSFQSPDATGHHVVEAPYNLHSISADAGPAHICTESDDVSSDGFPIPILCEEVAADSDESSGFQYVDDSSRTSPATSFSIHEMSNAHVLARTSSENCAYDESSPISTVAIPEVVDYSDPTDGPTEIPLIVISACETQIAEPADDTWSLSLLVPDADFHADDTYTSVPGASSGIAETDTSSDTYTAFKNPMKRNCKQSDLAVSASASVSTSQQDHSSLLSLISSNDSAAESGYLTSSTSLYLPSYAEIATGPPVVMSKDNKLAPAAADFGPVRTEKNDNFPDPIHAASSLNSIASIDCAMALSGRALALTTSAPQNLQDMQVVKMTASIVDSPLDSMDIDSTPSSSTTICCASSTPLQTCSSDTGDGVLGGTTIIDGAAEREHLECDTFTLQATNLLDSSDFIDCFEDDAPLVVENVFASQDATVSVDTQVGHVQEPLESLEHIPGDVITLSNPSHDFGMFSSELPPSSPPASQDSNLASYHLRVNPFGSNTQPEKFVDEPAEFLYDAPVTPSAFAPELSGELCLSSSPFPSSSPVRSSSPARIFSSSPPRETGCTPPSSSPPSSSPGAHKIDIIAQDTDMGDESALPSGKRSRSGGPQDDFECADSYKFETAEGPLPSKRTKLDVSLSPPRPPNPKRPTHMSQQQQRKKLAAPFRSPLVDKTASRQGVDAVYASGKPSADLRGCGTRPAENVSVSASEGKGPAPCVPVALKKDYTENAAKQFKSPLSVDAPARAGSPHGSGAFSSVKATPTIQALQGKLQILKQAVKIRSVGGGTEDDELEELVNKWITAGREIAWAVWDTVKDLDPGESIAAVKGKGGWFDDENFEGARKGGKKAFDGGWGYDDGDHGGRSRGLQRGWGWAQDESGNGKDEDAEMGKEQDTPDEEEADAPGHTPGTMLRHLGIAPETLGWNEDEGDFVDAA